MFNPSFRTNFLNSCFNSRDTSVSKVFPSHFNAASCSFTAKVKFDIFYYEEIVHLKMYRVALGKKQQTKKNLVNNVACLQMQLTEPK